MARLFNDVSFRAISLLISIFYAGLCIMTYYTFSRGGIPILSAKDAYFYLALSQLSLILWQANRFVDAYVKSKSKYHD